ncbi:serine hydrolase [Paenibacillus sp. T1]|uniref:Serine hydrolase n=2 Tax=Paenibacillus glycinis TaxID=2697035 RepID=A0ABW9XMK3_9BACL|nr:serine hydrolase [Paenibacillus glycinis]NBD23840.1 serine hydrolase [Paenibacillus glycinis]
MDFNALTAAIAPLNLRSCLISRQGELQYEHYREARIPEEVAKVNSVTKSVLSALFCIALDQGLLPEPETPASVFFPRLAADRDARKGDITLAHLLTMSAGFDWTEFGGQNSFPRMTRAPHWIDFVLEQPLAHAPGTRMEYNSGASQMLSAVLAQAAGMPVARFADLHLFGPLGIERYEWEQDPQGVHTGGFGLRLLPGDMLKFGLLYQQQGKWENARLLSRDLLARSVKPAIAAKAPNRGRYAWHWWTDSFAESADGPNPPAPDYYYARGFGGQYIYIVPVQDTVVVLTADKWRTDKPPTDVFRRHIAPLLAGMR